MKQLAEHITGLTGAVLGIFGIVALMNAYYAHRDDVVRRDLMSQSTRYAEIEKFYTDLLLEGQALSESQQKRLKLAQAQQLRIAEILIDDGQDSQ